MPDNDSLEQLRKATAALKSGMQGSSQSSTAVMDEGDEEAPAPKSKDPLDQLRAATAALKTSTAPKPSTPELATVKPNPFGIQSEQAPPVGAAAGTAGPLVKQETPYVDATQIPVNPFTNTYTAGPGMRTEEEIAKGGQIHATKSETRMAPGPGGGVPITVGPKEEAAAGSFILPGLNPHPTLQGNAPIIDPEKPILGNPMNPEDVAKHPIVAGIANVVSGLTTPANLSLMAASGGLGELGAAGKTLPRVASALFATQVAKGLYAQSPEFKKAFDDGNVPEAQRIATEMLLSGYLGFKATKHAALGESAPTGTRVVEPVENVAGLLEDKRGPVSKAVDATKQAASDLGYRAVHGEPRPQTTTPIPNEFLPQEAQPQVKFNRETANTLQKLGYSNQEISNLTADQMQRIVSGKIRAGAAPESSAAATPARPAPPVNTASGEQLVHEAPETLKAQTDALAKGTNPVVYFPKGTPNLPEPPENATVTVVKGDKPGAGTYYHSEDVTPAQVRAAVKDGTYPQLLGHEQTKEEAAKGTPAVAVARDAQGTELKASVVDTANQDAVKKQVATLGEQFPGAKFSVEPAEKVIARRLAAKNSALENINTLTARKDAWLKQFDAERQTNQVPTTPPQFHSDKAAQLNATNSTPERMLEGFNIDKERLEASRRTATTPEEKALIDDRLATTNQHIQELSGQKPLQKLQTRKSPNINLNVKAPDDVAKILNDRFYAVTGNRIPAAKLNQMTTGELLSGFGKLGLDEEIAKEANSALYDAGYRKLGTLQITRDGMKAPLSPTPEDAGALSDLAENHLQSNPVLAELLDHVAAGPIDKARVQELIKELPQNEETAKLSRAASALPASPGRSEGKATNQPVSTGLQNVSGRAEGVREGASAPGSKAGVGEASRSSEGVGSATTAKGQEVLGESEIGRGAGAVESAAAKPAETVTHSIKDEKNGIHVDVSKTENGYSISLHNIGKNDAEVTTPKENGFKKFSGEGYKGPYQVSEEDFIKHEAENKLRRYDNGAKQAQKEIDALGPRAATARAKIEVNRKYWQEVADRLKKEGPSATEIHGFRQNYIETVKKAISKGLEVPEAVINQRPEFRVAQTARARYEKGRHTSFANRSSAINETMQDERGFKVKRQDGKEITPEQIKQIDNGISDTEQAIGPLDDLLKATDVTIAHTSGKHPFLKTAGGLYSPGERTISMGVNDVLGRPIHALGHELAHWLDFESGKATGIESRIWSGEKAHKVSYISEAEDRNTEGGKLIREATQKINRYREAKEVSKEKYEGKTPEEHADLERLKVHLGSYWTQPREVFARLMEQYIATKLGKGNLSTDSLKYYEKAPGYWTADEFKKLMPAVEADIQRRIDGLRNGSQKPTATNATAPVAGAKVEVTSGPLEGKTVTVTKATEEGGVYVRSDENSRVRYVPAGSFEKVPPEPVKKSSPVGATSYSNPLFDPEVWKTALGYLEPAEAAGQADLRARTGELARKQAVLQEKLKAEHNRWRGRSDADMLAFADLVEDGEAARKDRGVTISPKIQAMLDQGKKSITPEDKKLATTLRTLLDDGRKAVQNLGTGKLENFIENYFPHIWEQKNKIGSAIGQVFGKKPLEGPKAFLKQRTIPTTAEGFDKDLRPVTTNPVDLTLLKMHEMNRYIMAHRLLDDLKAAGTAKFVGFGAQAPDGWRPLDDKVFQVLQYSETDKGMINRGRYYASEDIAQPINRYVGSGLKGMPLYDITRSFGNSLNQVQLGLSGFHLGTTSLNAVISQFALATKQVARGQVVKAAKNIISAPAAPIRNLIQGGGVTASYLRPEQAKKYAATAKAVETAGGRTGMGEEYTNNAIEKMLQSFANKKYFKGILQSIPAAVEAQAIPVLKWTVPKMKLGAFHDLASDIFDRAQRKGWTQEKTRSELQKAWDSIDNRFGQVVYDNLNWNKVAKDLAFIGVRSVGWNYGTFRELGGGVRDAASQAGRALKGEGFDVTDRMAYTFALPITIAALGALYMYAHTGKWPESFKDYFYPKNGKLESDGTEARSSLPSYMKDVYAYGTHPVDTAMHKVNPALALITEMLENKDYYGNEIRNTDDPVMTQLGQVLKHLGVSFLPFTFRNAQQSASIGRKDLVAKVENFLGVAPAPRNLERSEAAALAHDMIQRRMPQGARTTAEQQKAQRVFELEQQVRDIRAGKVSKDVILQKVNKGEVTEQDVMTAIKRAATPGLLRQFKELTIPEALKVWDVATSKEKEELKEAFAAKIQNRLPTMTRADIERYRPLLRNAIFGKGTTPTGIPLFPSFTQQPSIPTN